MCGLVGMCGSLEYKHKQVMKDLLFLDTLRGKDSTGLSAVARNRMVLTRKFTVPGYEFIEIPVVEKAMKVDDQLWLGHNRFKTTGDVSRANAHPFEVLDTDGDIMLIGAHNGTLNNKYSLETILGEKFETDSEALFNLLVDQPNFKEAINKLRGAWSLVWWDPTTNSVNFCRNDQRPLCFAFTKDRKVMMWASEAWMLINAASRNGVELAEAQNGIRAHSTSPDFLYTMEIPQRVGDRLGELKKEGGYVGAPDHVFQKNRYQHGYGMWKEWWDAEDPFDADEPKAAKEMAKGSEANSSKEGESNVVTMGFNVGGKRFFQGRQYSDKELQALRDNGCGWCGDPMLRNEAFEWLEPEVICCLNCVNDKHPNIRECVRRPDDHPVPVVIFEDDDIEEVLEAIETAGLDLKPNGVFDQTKKFHQKDSPEYKRLIEAAISSAKKAVG